MVLRDAVMILSAKSRGFHNPGRDVNLGSEFPN
jgi:hypothetical protein